MLASPRCHDGSNVKDEAIRPKYVALLDAYDRRKNLCNAFNLELDKIEEEDPSLLPMLAPFVDESRVYRSVTRRLDLDFGTGYHSRMQVEQI